VASLLTPGTDSDSVASGLSADAPGFTSIRRAGVSSQSNNIAFSNGAGHSQVHNSSAISSEGMALPQYLSSNLNYINSSKLNAAPASSSTTPTSNFHTYTSNSINNVSSSPDLWSQQHHHVVNPTSSYIQLNSMLPTAPHWPPSTFGSREGSQDDRSYRQPEECGLEKLNAYSFHNESRDSSNTTLGGQGVPMVQRQHQDFSSTTASPFSSHINNATKGYRGDELPPISRFAMNSLQPHQYMQHQQLPLYSRTSAYGNTATTSESRSGAVLNASASSQFTYSSTPRLFTPEDLTFHDQTGPTDEDNGFGYIDRNTVAGSDSYNPSVLQRVQPQQQQFSSQFCATGGEFYGYDTGSSNKIPVEFGGDFSYETASPPASNFIQGTRGNKNYLWGCYAPSKGGHGDVGRVSEAYTGAKSGVFSSASASGSLEAMWHRSINIAQPCAGYVNRGVVVTDLPAPRQLGLNSRSSIESTNIPVNGGNLQELQHRPPNAAAGQLVLTSPPTFSSLNVYQSLPSQSSLPPALLEESRLVARSSSPGDTSKGDLHPCFQDSYSSEAALPPFFSIEGLASPIAAAEKGKHPPDSVAISHQTKNEYVATPTIGNSKKNNRGSKISKNQKSGSKVHRKVSTSSGETMAATATVPAFPASTSSLAVATTLLTPYSSVGFPDQEEDIISSLRLNSGSPAPHFPEISNGSMHQNNARLAVNRPILPSANRSKKLTPSSPNFAEGHATAPPHYTAFFEDGSQSFDYSDFDYETNTGEDSSLGLPPTSFGVPSNAMKKRDWLIRMNRKLKETELGALDPGRIPIHAVMNAWAKTKSSEGAQMVEMWLRRVEKEVDMKNALVEIGTKMYTMAVDAWAKSGEKGAATRAEGILQHMNELYQNGSESLKPTTGIFNAVINAWARSGEKIAPLRAEQILEWMDKLNKNGNPDIKPDKYSYNTVIHAWAKSGGNQAAFKAQTLLTNMENMYNEGNSDTKPDTITYNVVINAWAKSGGEDAAIEAEKLLHKMHKLYDTGNLDVKPNVVTYGAVIDSWAKSGHEGAAARADSILANMIRIHQSDPIQNADLRPNTYVFNTVINAWAKSKQPDAASKAEEMLVAMGQLHACGIPGLKPDAFTYTAVIDAWAKSGYRGAATRADRLLEKMEAEYQAGDNDLKPNTFTYNAVINALAKSGEPGAAARAERVLHNMVKRHKSGNDDVKPTTINFNTVLDAFAKSGGKGAAERAEEILEWMDRLNKNGNLDVKPDTITFNAVIDAWARSGDRRAPSRAEQILDHMDELYKSGNNDVQPDTYTYNTVINAWAKSGENGSASRAEHILAVMERRCHGGDHHLKPNTRTHTSVIDAWAKSGERGAAARAEHILNAMQSQYEEGNLDVKPNSHTYNAVMNACAFTKHEEDRDEALAIAFRVFERLTSQKGMHPDAYTYTILLSVCANLLPKGEEERRFSHAKVLFEKCCDAGYVNDYVLRKLRQTVTEREYIYFVGSVEQSADRLPRHWTRNALKGGRENQWGGNNKTKRK